MYYDQDFVDGLVSKIKVPGGSLYVRDCAMTAGKILMKDPKVYKSFGVYWWAVKDALRQYFPDHSAWFMGPYDDPLMKERAWHGDQFKTVLAAMYYHSGQIMYSPDHEWTDRHGIVHDYSLYDENAGQ